MQTGLTNITSATTTTLVNEDLRTRSINSIAMTNTHASTAVTVELYVQDRTNTVEVLSTLVNSGEPGLGSADCTFDALTNVEVGDEVVFYDPISTAVVIPQKADLITVTNLRTSVACTLSDIVIAPDNAVAKFYQLEKGYIVKTDIPGQTTLVLDNIPTINNKTSTLKIKTTSAGLAVATPLTLNIT